MSKQRARKRAEARARKRAPKDRTGTAVPSKPADRKTASRSAREQRQRRRLWIVAVLWVAANAVIFLLTDTWNARWVGLTITTILVPLIVWLVWDPEGRVNL